MNYIFDLEGTIIKEHTPVELLPNVGEFFAAGDYENVGLASNAGGVGLRHWMSTWDPIPDNIDKYPTADMAISRVAKTLNAMARFVNPARLNWPETRISFAYRTRKGEWAPQPENPPNSKCWQQSWSKPAPGMLLDLIQMWGVSPAQVTMVGDRPADLGAALNAGCLFTWSHDFFEYVPETLWMEPNRKDVWPFNTVFPTGDDLEGVTRLYPSIRYFRLANEPPYIEIIEYKKSSFADNDEGFNKAMDKINDVAI
jgi:hypothetical protein